MSRRTPTYNVVAACDVQYDEEWRPTPTAPWRRGQPSMVSRDRWVEVRKVGEMEPPRANLARDLLGIWAQVGDRPPRDVARALRWVPSEVWDLMEGIASVVARGA